MRYRFYREHKYVTYKLYQLEAIIARTDFNIDTQIAKVRNALAALETLMHGHAMHEDQNLHELLRKKGSHVHLAIELDHRDHEIAYIKFNKNLENILASKDKNQRLSLAYEFFLSYRLFIAENLKHLHQEETIIMPELQRLYTDDELRAVESTTYKNMAAEDTALMLEELFPHLDANDHAFFLYDIKAADPAKFAKVWSTIAPKTSAILD